MKKALPILAIVLLLGVVGYFLKGAKKPGILSLNNQGGNVFTSIKDALSKSMSLKCVYKDDKGAETISYIKGGLVRVVTVGTGAPEEYGSILIIDKKMYMWSDTSKTGFIYEIEQPIDTTPYPTLKVEKGLEPEKQPGAAGQESVLAQIEKYKDACKVEKIDDSYFTVPTDVKFQDMAELQKQMMQGLPQGGSTDGESPAGSTDYEQYIQDMMKQAQDEGQ